MGEHADMMLDGTVCEHCGGYLDGETPGHPRYCSTQCRIDAGAAGDAVIVRQGFKPMPYRQYRKRKLVK